jgi:hypothetical protein
MSTGDDGFEVGEVVLTAGSGAIYGRLVRIGIYQTNVLEGDCMKRFAMYRFWADL